ncbi:MAG: OmpA family protein [Deltaproteobacteria bacterium]
MVPRLLPRCCPLDRQPGFSRASLAVPCIAALLALPARASAQGLEVRAELGGGTMLSPMQRNTDESQYGGITPGYNLAGQGSLRVGWSLRSIVAFELGIGGWVFPRGASTPGSVLSAVAGLRAEPMLGTVGRLVIDVHGGPAVTGTLLRGMFDAGLGFEFRAVQGLSVGPSVRLGYVVHTGRDDTGHQTPADAQSDAIFWSVGVAGTFRAHEPAPAAPPDHDHDGVADREDLCPDAPAHPPDPARLGCPLRDTDADGTFDDSDRCPTVPSGEHRDPDRPGCPLVDTDGDGVFDNVDRCAATPAGATPDPARPGCPDGDDDGDGIGNHRDVCPNTPPGIHPDPGRPGCPSPDRDGDGIADVVDHCPDRPGAPHPDPARNGCPGLVQIQGDQLRILRPVFFATGRDTILPRSNPVLQAVGDALRAVPDIHRITIEGHTDDVGDHEANLQLSVRRAHSVVAWLIHNGIEPDRLESRGYGDTRPLVPERSAAARAVNRRVEFRIVRPASPAPDATSTPPVSLRTSAQSGGST